MPADVYVFLLLLAALIALRFLRLPTGLHFLLFSALVVAQIAFVLRGLSRTRKGGR